MLSEAFGHDRYDVHHHSLSAFRANILGLFLPIPFALLYIVLYRASFPYVSHLDYPTLPTDRMIYIPLYLLSFFVILTVLITLHELIHAVIFRLSAQKGRRSIQIRFRVLTPSAHCVEALPLGIYRLALVAPLFLLVLPLAFVSVLFGDPFSFLVTLIMIFSIGGDLTALWITRKHSGKGIYILDNPTRAACEVFIPR